MELGYPNQRWSEKLIDPAPHLLKMKPPHFVHSLADKLKDLLCSNQEVVDEMLKA